MKRDFFTVYAGFRFLEEVKTQSLKAAERELLGRHQKFYSAAVFDENHVRLQSESVICPHCQHKIPAYKPFLSNRYIYKKTEKSKILEFTNPQVSILDVYHPRTLHLQDAQKENIEKSITCPHCFYQGIFTEEKSKGFIEEKKHCIKIGLELSLKALLSCKWRPKNFSLPLCKVFETVTFNLKNGHVFLRLEAENGAAIFTLDITNRENTSLFEDALFQMLFWNHTVLHRLKAFFQTHGVSISFQNNELDAEAFILLTRFQNYPKTFYEHLPFLKGTIDLDSCFTGAEKALQKAKNVPNILENSHLPNYKSIRKILFSNPWLFFFIPQMESLWSIFNDINLLCRCLSGAYIYQHLCSLLDYPDTQNFYRMYVEKKGKIGLLKCMEQTATLHIYAIPFLMQRKDLQQVEIQKWNTKYIVNATQSYPFMPGNITCRYQQPKRAEHMIIRSQFISNGFVFKQLKRKSEYETAARDLHNCLKDYIGRNLTVIGVQKGGRYVGAVELDDKVVMQNLAAHNAPMEENPDLYLAYQAFVKKFGLKELGYA